MDSTFWRKKRVLITGHTGFKGSWLSFWLQYLGAEVIGYSLAPPTHPNLFEVTGLSQGITSYQGDIRDLDHLTGVLNAEQPEIIFHMAAQSLVRRSYEAPTETIATNVMGTVNLLEAVRQLPSARAVVNVTSDKCYENHEQARGYQESDPMGGHDPYSSSKGCAELITAAYRKSFLAPRVAVATARAGNVIGGGDWAKDRLIPDLIKAFSEGHPVSIRHPKSVRPWQHVLEPLSGYLSLAQRLWTEGDRFSGGWNFGPSEEDPQPVAWVTERVSQLWGQNAAWKIADGVHPHEAQVLKLDCTKSKLLLGWQPRTSLETGLAWTVAWYQGFSEGRDPRVLMMNDITRFVSLETR